jgi:large subunit ribosomal protein L14
MIISRSLIRIVDNSGGKIGRCIKVLNKSPKTKVGDLAVVSLKKVRPRKVHKGKKKEQLKKGIIKLALIISIKRNLHRKGGLKLKIFQTYGLLVSPKGNALGSRFNTALPKELRLEKWLKLIIKSPRLF